MKYIFNLETCKTKQKSYKMLFICFKMSTTH